MLGEVKVWKMTEKQRQEYIEKHPIKPSSNPKKKREAFADSPIDYKWRGEKGADSRWG
jgi:hypothetical protein